MRHRRGRCPPLMATKSEQEGNWTASSVNYIIFAIHYPLFATDTLKGPKIRTNFDLFSVKTFFFLGHIAKTFYAKEKFHSEFLTLYLSSASHLGSEQALAPVRLPDFNGSIYSTNIRIRLCYNCYNKKPDYAR